MIGKRDDYTQGRNELVGNGRLAKLDPLVVALQPHKFFEMRLVDEGQHIAGLRVEIETLDLNFHGSLFLRLARGLIRCKMI